MIVVPFDEKKGLKSCTLSVSHFAIRIYLLCFSAPILFHQVLCVSCPLITNQERGKSRNWAQKDSFLWVSTRNVGKNDELCPIFPDSCPFSSQAFLFFSASVGLPITLFHATWHTLFQKIVEHSVEQVTANVERGTPSKGRGKEKETFLWLASKLSSLSLPHAPQSLIPNLVWFSPS